MQARPDVAAILEFWRERTSILEFEAGNTRISAEVIARRETSVHFGFDCIAIVQAERQRLETGRQIRRQDDDSGWSLTVSVSTTVWLAYRFRRFDPHYRRCFFRIPTNRRVANTLV